MCGIIGIFNAKNANNNIKKGLKIIKNRGKDYYGIANELDFDYKKKIDLLKLHSNNENAIGHCLHSIVSFIPQPLVNNKSKNRFVINCEIYNWKHLNKKYKLKAENDAEMMFKLIEKKGKTTKQLASLLREVDGVYAFVFWNVKKKIVYGARDIIGIKPLCFSTTQISVDKNKLNKSSFAFSSEMKVLEELGYKNNQELNPRKILMYNLKTKKARQSNRPFFKITPVNKKTHKQIKKDVLGLAVNAVAKRIPDQKIGILFSGGIDSTFIAYACKKLGLKPTLYTSVLDTKSQGLNMKTPEDLIWARKVSKALGFKLRINKIKLSDVPRYLEKIVPLIEDSNVVKVGVGLTFYGACELAKKDNVKVIFSGLGSEEIFAGYNRHKKSNDINKECLSGILKIYERDLYRDDVITMDNKIELRLPFLDLELVNYALKIPVKYKLKEDSSKVVSNKIIIREVARMLEVPEEFAERKKKAAQYGSSFDKAISKLAKRNKFKFKSEYLDSFSDKKIMRLGVLFSSGKDSHYAMEIMQKQNYEISCLITLISKNKDSYMFHTPNINLAKMQASCLKLPLIEQTTVGEKEKELKDLEKAIKTAKNKYKIEGIVTGAIFSTYQRDRVEKICDKLGLKIFSPLWHMNQETEMRELVREGYEIILGSIAADGLTKKWLGRKVSDKMISELIKIHAKNKINIAGEGGEFESLVLDSPMYKKKIKIEKFEVKLENECTGKFIVKKAKIVKK
ncbi:diphthine--ammonia ligase [Candidatus Woesearchaeota archaeon]|jgi:diphthine-ammonia ligase|nr:diphthine--ammonia ligase [Candidatus Woesearchaeota archaeon]MBT6041437.1 diphthine--ammonia ligase [Candidatus Woesearchaeota archaeon]MBT6337320.1 diphthine--ammonia ligase [Candidatus Woesearchaeota archaeon]MBT7927197.1 diphthine--ammonia ligase [Candidatus Woesearchaeota archaeon]